MKSYEEGCLGATRAPDDTLLDLSFQAYEPGQYPKRLKTIPCTAELPLPSRCPRLELGYPPIPHGGLLSPTGVISSLASGS